MSYRSTALTFVLFVSIALTSCTGGDQAVGAAEPDALEAGNIVLYGPEPELAGQGDQPEVLTGSIVLLPDDERDGTGLGNVLNMGTNRNELRTETTMGTTLDAARQNGWHVVDLPAGGDWSIETDPGTYTLCYTDESLWWCSRFELTDSTMVEFGQDDTRFANGTAFPNWFALS